MDIHAQLVLTSGPGLSLSPQLYARKASLTNKYTEHHIQHKTAHCNNYQKRAQRGGVSMEDAAEGVAVAGQPPIVRGQRINKRSLRNKSLSVTFNEKDLR